MAKFKDASIGESLEKCFPLKIVGVDSIPMPYQFVDLEKLSLDELADIAVVMMDVCKNKKGVGLSAVQCGLPIDLFIARDNKENFRIFCKGSYDGQGNMMDSMESCLSLYDKYGLLRRFVVKRFGKIKLDAYELDLSQVPYRLNKIRQDFAGLFAVVLQHEIDHSRGILISDMGREVEVVP
jgi:peptide deformylase